MNRPPVSVIVAARNEASGIVASLRSVLALAQPEDEIIVVDDASTDGTSELVACMGHEKISLTTLEQNVGRAAARNLAVSKASRPFIAIHDADDFALRERLDAPMSLLRDHPELVSAGSQAISRTARGKLWMHGTYPLDWATIEDSLRSGVMPMCHPTVVVRREAFLAVGGYDPTYLRAQDLELFRRLAETGPMRNSPQYGLLYSNEVWLDRERWAKTRAYRRRMMGEPERGPLDALRYAASLGRRAERFMVTHKRASSLISPEVQHS